MFKIKKNINYTLDSIGKIIELNEELALTDVSAYNFKNSNPMM